LDAEGRRSDHTPCYRPFIMAKPSKKKTKWFTPKTPTSKYLPAKARRRGASQARKKSAQGSGSQRHGAAPNPHLLVAPTLPPKGPFDALGNELLLELFVHLDSDSPSAWDLTCKRCVPLTDCSALACPHNVLFRFHLIASSAHCRSTFFLRRYPAAYAIRYSLTRARLYLRTPELLEMLIRGGALFSRYLIQSMSRSQMNSL